MLTKEEIKQIKEHLDKAQNPVFFFDNDQDGLCSFLLLRKYIGRGKGVAIKSFPELDENYFRKVEEFNADYIFILDKPLVSKDFFARALEKNIPIVWIDHHDVECKIPENVFYFNPCSKRKESEPVTALCYQLTNQKLNLWLAVIGCISDSYLPDFYLEFKEIYPELSIDTNNAFEVLYNSRIGELAMLFSNGLKDKTTNVVAMLKFLIDAKGPYDALEENPKTYSFHKRSRQLYSKYKDLVDRAKKIAENSDKLIFFKYSGNLSVSGELANHIKYLFPKKIVFIAYIREDKVNFSLRGKNIKEFFEKISKNFEEITGGGHNDAVGGQMQVKVLEEFKKKLEGEIQ